MVTLVQDVRIVSLNRCFRNAANTILEHLIANSARILQIFIVLASDLLAGISVANPPLFLQCNTALVDESLNYFLFSNYCACAGHTLPRQGDHP
jgi:hypothetical protein